MNDEQKIMDVLRKHHEFVRERELNPVMTVLVGSQNYDLATPDSDYDTFTFVLPSIKAIAGLAEPISTTLADEHGHINIKDIRLALNNLKRTSPNSVECFASHYKYVEDGFKFLSDMAPIAFRCDTRNMMNAIGGMATQLKTRNMSSGKRLAHILRLHCMVYNYMNIRSDILSMTEMEHDLAMKAKLNPNKPDWELLIPEWERIVQEDVEVDLGYYDDRAKYGLELIEYAQVRCVRRAVDGY